MESSHSPAAVLLTTVVPVSAAPAIAAPIAAMLLAAAALATPSRRKIPARREALALDAAGADIRTLRAAPKLVDELSSLGAFLEMALLLALLLIMMLGLGE